MFFKVGVLKSFAKFTGKHRCWNLFLIKLLARRPEKRLQFRRFPVKFAEFLITLFFYRTPRVAASKHIRISFKIKEHGLV